MGLESAENLLEGVAASKDRGLARLLNALSIRHVGNRVATVLADRFRTMDVLLACRRRRAKRKRDENRRRSSPKSVHDFLPSRVSGVKAIGELRATRCRRWKPPRCRQRLARFSDWRCWLLVVTGTLSKHSRDQIEELITLHGGRAASSISQKTDYLVAGEKAGSKLEKAKDLGVKVLSESDFEKLIV